LLCTLYNLNGHASYTLLLTFGPTWAVASEHLWHLITKLTTFKTILLSSGLLRMYTFRPQANLAGMLPSTVPAVMSTVFAVVSTVFAVVSTVPAMMSTGIAVMSTKPAVMSAHLL